ncbi:serine hydrolase [Salinispora tropica]|uniref:Beta-lactamase n=1 Tax=Salinispora tropica (strain ATCC BAA-916 / DSM 44818 / JCM 13857 / NBRC 105044 / CNB-440) TaxID=369723 RepID=A4X9J3_SALTO|nr:serine hydrolase [Salinispora tropica]ABP55567.1 beta-lactamase [Salinispora tropica CNB-440]
MIFVGLDAHLDRVPGTVSAYLARLDATAPTWIRHPATTHYAASTMKVAVLVALYRALEAGRLASDTAVPVRNEFDSAQPGAARFGCTRPVHNDDDVWDRLGGTAPLRWLAERMIVRSSNLATNLLLDQVGLPAVADVWARAGARHSVTGRGIEDFAARAGGITNLITAADLAALLRDLALGATRPGPLATPESCTAMLELLVAQEHREDLAVGLPVGARIAHKNGWVRGVRHSVGVVYPDDAPPYVLAVCTTNDDPDHSPDEDACQLIADISARAFARRHQLG